MLKVATGAGSIFLYTDFVWIYAYLMQTLCRLMKTTCRSYVDFMRILCRYMQTAIPCLEAEAIGFQRA
jgi:hypothetical protein